MIKEDFESKKGKIDINEEEIVYEKLNDKYLKVKECLSRCGNIVVSSNTASETETILKSFLIPE